MKKREQTGSATLKKSNLSAGVKWQPVLGAEASLLAENQSLPPAEISRIQSSAARVLGSCVCPTDLPLVPTNVGLIVGHVQSGKTANFITMMAMARDNHFPLIVLLAGSSVNLVKQTRNRIGSERGGIGTDTRGDRQWLHIPFDVKDTANNAAATRTRLNNHLRDWLDDDVDNDDRKTILITVMKHHAHLAGLADALSGCNCLTRLATLVIDDEADQISLNTKVRQDEESTNYREIARLRDALAIHSYLQVTATPQAPLLVHLEDVLSPDFVKVLQPGDGYAGGKTFYPGGASSPLLVDIPEDEQYIEDELPVEPPQSLKAALAHFFVTAAIWKCTNGSSGNCSMMVHPDRKTNVHRHYHRWIRQIRANWEDLLGRTSEPDYPDLVQLLKSSYLGISRTWHHSEGAMKSIPEFNEVLRRLPRQMRKTQLTLVNASSGQTPQIDWKQEQCHILVGGLALDRGFTVEGLMVSYMPRSLGVGNADTLQQRARFFGYKKSYLGLCRLWLPAGVAHAFRNYVVHEEQMRKHLLELEQKGKPLSEWKRALVLDPSLKLTRSSVIGLSLSRANLRRSDWISIEHLGLSLSDTKQLMGRHISEVSDRLEAFARELIETGRLANLQPPPSGGPTARHQCCQVSAEELLELTTSLRFVSVGDTDRMLAAQLSLRAAIETTGVELSNFPCDVLLMGPGFDPNAAIRNRTQRKSGGITLQQGESGSGGGYVGDKAYKSADLAGQLPTLQLHRLIVTVEGEDGARACGEVWSCSLYLPKEMRANWHLGSD